MTLYIQLRNFSRIEFDSLLLFRRELRNYLTRKNQEVMRLSEG